MKGSQTFPVSSSEKLLTAKLSAVSCNAILRTYITDFSFLHCRGGAEGGKAALDRRQAG